MTYTHYAGSGSPYWVKQEQKESGSYYLESRTFYDGMGRVVQTQAEAADSSQSILVNTQYQPLGVLRASVPYTVTGGLGGYRTPDWNQAKTQTTYDALGRVTQVTQADGTTVKSFYQNRQTAVLDALNRQTISETDAVGRLYRVQQYLGTTGGQPNWGAAVYAHSVYTYTVSDQLEQMTGPDEALTTVTYDLLGRKTSMKDPDMGVWSYTYDAVGNLLTQTDARGTKLWFGYDGLNRLTQKRLTNASGTPLANYTYDDTSNDNKGKGRRTGMSDSSGITSWVYDARGRLVQESKYVNGTGGGTFVTQWGYDSADRMTQLVYPGGEGVNFVYNEQGLLRRMYTTGLDYVQSTAYDGAGRVTQRVLGSSTVLLAEYTYFPWTMAGGRLQRMTLGTTGATTSLQDLTYSYDAVGNVKQQLSSALGSGASQKQCFSYDGLNRLTAGFTGDTNCAAYLGVGNGPFEEQYTYFANGNLDHKKIVQPTNQDNAYLYAAPVSGCTAGTLATKPHAVRQAGSNAYSYDCNGNMTGRTVGGVAYTLVYDAENRLQQVKQGSTVLASYTYDADGNRVKADFGGSVTVYVGAYYEKTTSGSSTTITKYYQAGGQRIALRVNGVVRWLATDHLGSTALTASETGGRLSEIRYKPWGESRYTFGATPTQRRFTGQVLDSVAGGLYFYNARYYDPALGRFTQADTLVPNAGNPQNLNRYSYALNNSVRFSDPSGHAAVCGTSVDGGCGVTPPRSSKPVIVPLPPSTPPLGTPSPIFASPSWNYIIESGGVYGNGVIRYGARRFPIYLPPRAWYYPGSNRHPRYDPNDQSPKLLPSGSYVADFWYGEETGYQENLVLGTWRITHTANVLRPPSISEGIAGYVTGINNAPDDLPPEYGAPPIEIQTNALTIGLFGINGMLQAVNVAHFYLQQNDTGSHRVIVVIEPTTGGQAYYVVHGGLVPVMHGPNVWH